MLRSSYIYYYYEIYTNYNFRIMAVPNNMVYFTGYEFLKEKSLISNQFLNPLLCGGFARILAATTISPLELLRTRLQ